MEKSLYPEYTQKYFPQLVLAVTEQLNGRPLNNPIPFLFTELLTPYYSADSRWQSISAKYGGIAADVVALGASIPLKKRDKLHSYVGDIPKLGTSRSLDETEMKNIDNMIAQNRPEEEIVRRIFNDVPFVISAVDERLEDIFLSMLSTGVGLATRNEGLGVRLNMHYDDYPDNHAGVSAVWATVSGSTVTTNTSAKPVSDIQNTIDLIERDGNVCSTILADDTALRAMYENAQVRNYFGFQNNYAGDLTAIPTLSLAQLQQLFMNNWGVTLRRVARATRTEIDGVREPHKAWAKGRMVFLCDEKIGSIVYTATAEENRPVAGVVYQKANDYTLVAQYSEKKPLMEFTESQAMATPILQNVNRIYSLDTLTPIA